MADSGEYTPETIASRQKIADQLLLQVVKPREIRHWAQGLGQLGEAALGGWLGYKAEQEQKEGSVAQAEAIAKLLGGSPSASAAPAAVPPSVASPPTRSASVQEVAPGDFNSIDALASPAGKFDPNYAPTVGAANRAVASVESGGNYGALGPETGGDRAYGKHQVMGKNIGPWTKEVTGQELTPEQFLQKPDTQDAVFNSKFGGNVQKYGNVTDPASIWFSGKPMAEAGNRKDALGTTVPSYVQKVAGALQPPTQPPTQPTAAPTAPTGDSRDQIAAMLRDPNPYVRKMATQLGQAAVAKQLNQQPKYHKLNDETLFEEGSGKTMLAGSGFKALVDPAERAAHGIPADDKRPYQLGPGNKLINPPAETRLTVDQRQESAFETKAGQLQAERLDKIVQEGMTAKNMISDMHALKDIGSRISTGKTAEIKNALGPYAEALGLKIEDLGDLQAYDAIVQKIAPTLRVAGSGATSDFEMRSFLKALPGLGKTPEGNEIIGNTFNAIAEQKTAAAEIAGKVLHKEISRAEGDKMLRDLPDPLSLWKAGRGKLPTARETAPAPKKAAGAPKPGTVEDGFRFIGGDPAKPESWEKES